MGSSYELDKCAFSNLTYAQWLNGTILQNPLENQVVTSDGYVKNYSPYSNFWIEPEYHYWREQNGLSGLDPLVATFATKQTYYSFNTTTGLYSQKNFQDNLLDPSAIWPWLPNFDDYLRSVTINFGLTSLFQQRTPREMIEGYTSPLLAKMETYTTELFGGSTI